MTIEVIGPDGASTMFPAGTPTSVMQAAMARVYGGPRTAGSALAQLSDPEPPQPPSAGGQPLPPALQGQSDPAAGAAPNLPLAALPPGGGYGPIVDAAQAAAGPHLNALASDPTPVWNGRLALLSHARAVRDAAEAMAGSMLDAGVSPVLAGLSADADTGDWGLPKSLNDVTGSPPTAATWLGLYHTLPSLMETDPWTGEALPDADSPRNANIARIAGQLSSAFVGDPLTGEGGAIPGYGPIQGVFGDPFSIRAAHDAMEGTLFSSDPSALTSAWAKASTPAEQTAARSAITSDIQDRIQSGQILPGQLGSPSMQSRLASMFGPAGAQAIAANGEAVVNARLATLRGVSGQAGFSGPWLDNAVAPAADFAGSAGDGGFGRLLPANFITPPAGAAPRVVANISPPAQGAGSSHLGYGVGDNPNKTGVAAGAGPLSAKHPPVTAIGPSLTISDAARDFIRNSELRTGTSDPYLDVTPDGNQNPTFGYGHRILPSDQAAFDASISHLDTGQRMALAEGIFNQDIGNAQRLVTARLGPDLTSRLTQNQFDALVADAFNAGSAGALGGGMMADIRAGNMFAAGQQFNAWHATDGITRRQVIDPGLIRRSLREAAIFNNSDYHYIPTDDQVNAIWRRGN